MEWQWWPTKICCCCLQKWNRVALKLTTFFNPLLWGDGRRNDWHRCTANLEGNVSDRALRRTNCWIQPNVVLRSTHRETQEESTARELNGGLWSYVMIGMRKEKMEWLSREVIMDYMGNDLLAKNLPIRHEKLTVALLRKAQCKWPRKEFDNWLKTRCGRRIPGSWCWAKERWFFFFV